MLKMLWDILKLQVVRRSFLPFLTRPSEANDASFSDFFIFHFLTTFSFFHSLPLLPYRPFSFLLVPPSFSSLLLPRPALSKSFRIRKRPFSIDLDESVTDGRTNRPTDGKGLLQRCEDASKNGRSRERMRAPIYGYKHTLNLIKVFFCLNHGNQCFMSFEKISTSRLIVRHSAFFASSRFRNKGHRQKPENVKM